MTLALTLTLTLALLGATYTLNAARPAAAPSGECLENYKEVIVLLQAGQRLQARARAALIRCEHLRAEALKLVERSRPITAAGAGGGSPGAADTRRPTDRACL